MPTRAPITRFNDDTGARYDAAAAKLAWQRTLDFLNAKLKA